MTARKAIADELKATRARRARLSDEAVDDCLSASLEAREDALAWALGIVEWRSEKTTKDSPQ